MLSDEHMLARLAALKTATMVELKKQWLELFDGTPPRYSRRYLEARLAYRLQELTYGGLVPATLRRLEVLGQGFVRDGGGKSRARAGAASPVPA